MLGCLWYSNENSLDQKRFDIATIVIKQMPKKTQEFMVLRMSSNICLVFREEPTVTVWQAVFEGLISWFCLSWGLGIVWDMEIPRDLEGFWQGLGSMGGEFRANEMGIPNQGMVIQRRGSETDPFCWLEEMSPPPHPKKVSTKNRRYLPHLTVRMWVKLSCLSVLGREPLA